MFGAVRVPAIRRTAPALSAGGDGMAGVMEKLGKKTKNKHEEKAEKAECKRLRKEAEARGALYLLHWRSMVPAVTNKGSAGEGMGETKQYLAAVHDDLKRVEKVSKVGLISCAYSGF